MVLGNGAGRARLTGAKNVQRVTRTPARRGDGCRILLRVLIGLIFLASSVQRFKENVRKTKKHQSVEGDVTQPSSNPDCFVREMQLAQRLSIKPDRLSGKTIIKC